MLQLVAGEAAHIVFTRMNSPRACSPELLAARAQVMGYRSYTIQPDIRRAIAAAEDMATDDDLICVCGSFYLAGDARKLILQTHAASGAQP